MNKSKTSQFNQNHEISCFLWWSNYFNNFWDLKYYFLFKSNIQELETHYSKTEVNIREIGSHLRPRNNLDYNNYYFTKNKPDKINS